MPLKLKPRKNIWYIIGTITTIGGEKCRVRETTDFTLSQRMQAEHKLSSVLADAVAGMYLAKEVKLKRTVGDVVDLMLNRASPIGGTDAGYLEHFKDYYGGVELSKAKPSEIMAWCNRPGQKANSTARRWGTLRSMFNHASTQGFDVPTEIFKLKATIEDDARNRWLTENERDDFLEICRVHEPEIVREMTFLFYTGVRLGEMFSMNDQQILGSGDSAFFVSRKGKKRVKHTRTIPLPKKAIDVIGKRKSGLVFSSPSGEMWDRKNFYRYYNRAVDLAKLDDFFCHDARHTYASHLVQKGASLRAVADLLGHKSLSMVMRYSHLSKSHLSDTVALLEKRDTNLTHTISFQKFNFAGNSSGIRVEDNVSA